MFKKVIAMLLTSIMVLSGTVVSFGMDKGYEGTDIATSIDLDNIENDPRITEITLEGTAKDTMNIKSISYSQAVKEAMDIEKNIVSKLTKEQQDKYEIDPRSVLKSYKFRDSYVVPEDRRYKVEMTATLVIVSDSLNSKIISEVYNTSCKAATGVHETRWIEKDEYAKISYDKKRVDLEFTGYFEEVMSISDSYGFSSPIFSYEHETGYEMTYTSDYVYPETYFEVM